MQDLKLLSAGYIRRKARYTIPDPATLLRDLVRVFNMSENTLSWQLFRF
jgi:hypothetical protein